MCPACLPARQPTRQDPHGTVIGRVGLGGQSRVHTPGASQRHVMAWSPAGSIPPLSPQYSLHSFYPSRRAASATYSALGRRSSRNDNRCLANAPQSHPLFHQTQTVCSLLRRAGFGCAAVKGGWCSPGHANENAQLRVGVGVADCFPRGAARRGYILRPPERKELGL